MKKNYLINLHAVPLKLLFVLTLCMASLPSTAQQSQIDLPSTNVSVEQVIGQIESQSGLMIGVNHKKFDVSRKVTAVPPTQSLENLLKLIVSGTGHTYIKSGKHVVIVTDSSPKQQKRQVKRILADAATLTDKADSAKYTSKEILEADSVYMSDQEIEIREYYSVDQVMSDKTLSFTANDPNVFTPLERKSPSFALKTNLLHGIGTLTPNLGIEFGMGRRTTLEIAGGWNPWNRKGSYSDNKKLIHTYIQPEFRLWTCERFNGHFFGVHALGANYNISGHNLHFLDFKKANRYEGYALGGGISYGYGAMLSKNLGLEFTVGVGVLWLTYDRYNCDKCSWDKEKFTKTRFSPTKAGVSLVYLIK